MRLRSWGVLLTALFTATTAMAGANYPARTGGNYDGPRWYGYFFNNNLVAANADHTNITMVGSGFGTGTRDLQTATTFIEAALREAQRNNMQAMVDAEVFLFATGKPCYTNNPNAAADFQSLVQTLESDGLLIPNHPESSTVSSFYVADEPDQNCLYDTFGTHVPNPVLLNAISAIRQNADTTNFPLATIVTKDSYSDMPEGVGLFDWVGMDDYHYGVTDYLNDFSGFEGSLQAWDVVGGTPQHFFLVPLVSNIGSSFSDPYYYGATSLQDKFFADGTVIGIMPFKWSADTDSNGMNASSWWVSGYIALGNSIVHPQTGGLTLSPSNSSSGSLVLNWPQDATATYYQVYQSAAGGGAPWISTNVSTNSYTVTNLANGIYAFYVQDCDASGCTPSTAQTVNGTVNISAPVSLNLSPATSRSGSFTLSWKSPWNGPYPFQQYRIFQSFNGGGWTWTATVNNTTSHVFTNLAPGSYTYYVEACNQGSDGWSDCSGASGKVTETVALSAPSGLTFSPSGTSTTGSFTLSWNSSWNGPYPFEQYRIYQSSNGGASWTWVYTINNTTSQAISGLGDGTYTYQIQACNTAACGSFSSTASETVSRGGGGTGGGGGGCPPKPYQCQLVMPDDYVASRGDQATPDRLALAKQYEGAMAGVASPRAERAQRAPSLILPGEEVAWQQRWPAAPEMASATDVHRLPGDAQLARRVNTLYERFQ